uniref:Rab-GAP TBC domain-containing protein n=1 Tax=Canis lupus familiaris TaxID=9615 RepID=A0A8C0YYV6_CANLF
GRGSPGPTPPAWEAALPSGKSGSSQGSEGGGHTGVRAWGGALPRHPPPRLVQEEALTVGAWGLLRLLRPGLPEAPQVPGSSRAHPPKSSPRPEEAHGEWELLRLHPRGLGRGVGGTALPPSCPELGSRSSPWGPGALGGWAGPWGACPPDSRGRGVGPEHLLPSRQDEEQMSTGIYTPKWFLQCFLGRTPFSLTLKLWDAYVLDGERVLTAMAYTILKVHRSK